MARHKSSESVSVSFIERLPRAIAIELMRHGRFGLIDLLRCRAVSRGVKKWAEDLLRHEVVALSASLHSIDAFYNNMHSGTDGDFLSTLKTMNQQWINHRPNQCEITLKDISRVLRLCQSVRIIALNDMFRPVEVNTEDNSFEEIERELSLSWSQVEGLAMPPYSLNDASLSLIAKNVNLKYLDSSLSFISGLGLKNLGKLRGSCMKALILSGAHNLNCYPIKRKTSSLAILSLARYFHKLEILDLSATGLYDSDICTLANAPIARSLVEVDFTDNHRVTKKAIALFVEKATNLKKLHISNDALDIELFRRVRKHTDVLTITADGEQRNANQNRFFVKEQSGTFWSVFHI